MAGFASIFLIALIFNTEYDISVLAVVLSLVAAIVYSAGYLFFFRGFEKGNVSIVAATMNLWAVFTMIFAFLFMGQRLTVTQTVGVVMIISGAAFSSIDWNSLRDQRIEFSLGVKEAVLGAFFFGIFWNISEIVSEEIGWLLTTLLVKLGIAIFLLIFSFAVKQELALNNIPAKIKASIFLMGIVEVSTVALVNYGLTIGDAILITPIASALSVVTIALAIIFLRDKISALQGLGVVAAILGIIVTAF